MGMMDSHQSHTNKLETQSSSTSLSSQPSLPFIPSLTLPSSNHHHLIFDHSCLTTVKAHTSYVSSITLAGKFLYTGSSDREIRWWRRNPSNPNLDEEEEKNPNHNLVSAGKGAVKSIVVSSDKLFSSHQDHKIRVWKITNNDQFHPKYTRLATLPTLHDRTIKLLTPKNTVQIRRHKKSTWVNHVDSVSALALSTDESLLYSVSWDRTLKIWRTSDFKCLESITDAHDDAINALALDNDGNVYTGSADKKIKVWRRKQGEKRHFLVEELEKHTSGVNALALNNDGSVLYSGASDMTVLVWEKNERGLIGVVGGLRGHKKPVLCLGVVGELVCSGSADRSVRIWRKVERDCYFCVKVLEGHRGAVKCLTATVENCNNNQSDSSTNSYLIYSGGLDCDIKVWRISVPLHL